MNTISILDSGEFSNQFGASLPRIFAPLRELEAIGYLQISNIHYVLSPITGKPFPEEKDPEEEEPEEEEPEEKDPEEEEPEEEDPEEEEPEEEEPDVLFHARHAMRRSVEEERVRATAQAFKLAPPAGIDCLGIDTLAPVVSLNQRPGNSRNEILEILLQQAHIKRIILLPPYFTDTAELSKFIELDTAAKIVVWCPYRFSDGVVFAKNSFKKSEIAAATLSVKCGPYPKEGFISEFSLPWLDALFSIIGGITENSIRISEPAGLPVYSISARHENVLSTILLSTAGASFQNVDHCHLSLFSVQMESIELTNSLCSYEHQTPEVHYQSGMTSHDTIRSDRNGSRQLIRACMDDTTHLSLPTLETFLKTQKVIDALLAESSVS